jgi:hypothetical protein
MVPEQDGQQQSAPEHVHGVIITSVTAGLPKRIQQGSVGNGLEEGANGLEGGRVLENVPREQGSGHGDFHGNLAGLGKQLRATLIQRNTYPFGSAGGRKIAKKSEKSNFQTKFQQDLGDDTFQAAGNTQKRRALGTTHQALFL